MPDTPDQMDDIRARIREMIDAMIDRAGRDNYTESQLQSVHLKIIKRVAKVMRPDTAVAYERLFGFTDQARAYLSDSGKRVRLNPVTMRHLEKIRATLKELKICSDAPNFGDKPSSWLPFLDHALTAIEGQPAVLGPVIADVFDGKAGESPPDGAVHTALVRKPADPGPVVLSSKVIPAFNFTIRVPVHFMGREDTLDAIEVALKQCKGQLAIAALYGMRGVGKTTIALAYGIHPVKAALPN